MKKTIQTIARHCFRLTGHPRAYTAWKLLKRLNFRRYCFGLQTGIWALFCALPAAAYDIRPQDVAAAAAWIEANSDLRLYRGLPSVSWASPARLRQLDSGPPIVRGRLVGLYLPDFHAIFLHEGSRCPSWLIHELAHAMDPSVGDAHAEDRAYAVQDRFKAQTGSC